ncbi:MAG: hypothetical protein ACRC42_01200 [Mycoplasma sp.]
MSNTEKKKTSNKKQNETKNKVEVEKEKDFMSDFLVILLTILTLGWFKYHLENKIKEANEKMESSKDGETVVTLKTSEKIPFKIDAFVLNLGGVENISSTTSSLSTLKLELVDAKLIIQEEIKKLGARGIMISGNKVSIILGDYAIHLSSELEKIISSKENKEEVVEDKKTPTEAEVSEEQKVLVEKVMVA